MVDFDKRIHRENTNNVKYDLRETYFGNKNLLPMWVADMDFESPDFITKAVIERANHLIYGYSFRPEGYYQSMINWVKRRLAWELQKEWLLFTPGIVPAINFSVHTYTEPGDGIIVQTPVYFPFFSAIKNNGRNLIENQLILSDGRYTMDFDDLEKKAKDAKMLFLCNPHNPVGRCWTGEELQQLSEICLKNNVIVISDEIHNDLILPGFRHTPTALLSDEIAQNTVTCIAPSKTFNIAGLSTSTVIIQNDALRKKFESTLKKLHISSGNLFGTVASQAGYTHGDRWLDELLKYVSENFNYLGNVLENEFSTLKLIKAEATYLGWIDFRETGMTDKAIKDTLIQKAELGLSHGPIFGSGGSGFQRINLAAPRSVVEEAVERLKTVFS